MKRSFVDLHVHSFFSDGSMSPEEIAIAAKENDVYLLALTDHDTIDGSQILREECSKYGIRCIPAVEIDSLDGNTNFHILAYGFDDNNNDFVQFLKHARFLLDESSIKLIELMQKDFSDLSIADFMDFTYDRRLGGWKALHYLMEKGLTSSLKEGVKFYIRYNMTYEKSGYSTIAAIAYRIRKAGGYSVLAHPGELIDSTDIGKFRDELNRVVSYGLDGIECYYPSHSGDITQACIDVCKEKNLLITAGSDCHGVFGKTRVGEMDIPCDRLFLKDLI